MVPWLNILFVCLLQLSQIWRCLLETPCFNSFHRCSTGFWSGLIEGHYRTVQCFVLNHSLVFLAVCVLDHYPVGGPMTSDWDQPLWNWAPHFPPECPDNIEISLNPAQIHMPQSSPRTWQSLLHVSLLVQCSLDCMLHFCICEHRVNVTCQKAPALFPLSKRHSHRSSVAYQYVFAKIPVLLFYDLLSTATSFMVVILAQTVMDGTIRLWHTLNLEFTSNIFGSCSGRYWATPCIFIVKSNITGLIMTASLKK